ncbi:DUF5623 domain-containing protein [Burkholderia sp. AU45388]|uniref:DUF5623 domain-containing protein n=1 Tax=Burkholderia sp. AU45388 TaxID=3059206 RepID=UPI00264EC17C|nr:DUF5623 domain-containing protein [Burkholderia sp. AU45388]MDN7431389.1 DUF5623 domain-containing protein [Burkholderia sp. AU45388]
MPSINAQPSTLDGIKRLAKTIKRERKIPHHQALDEASREAGYQNLRHAQSQIEHPTTHAAYLSAYWANPGGAGRETLTIRLPKPLADVIASHQLRTAKNLGWFFLESVDHIELRTDVSNQQLARNELLAAARTLRFMAATGLRPTTTQQQRRPMRVFDDLPGFDHPSRWIDGETGAWVFIDEPYAVLEPEKRHRWVADHGIHMATPEWDGLHSPTTIPHVFCSDQTLLARLSKQLVQLGGRGKVQEWDGESARYWSQFVSPGRQATGKSRRARQMPAPRGVERNGALPYGSGIGGIESRWRPAKRMPLDMHLTVGPLVHALDHHRFPGGPRRSIAFVRTTLDDWIQMEYPGDEMSDEQFRAAYYGTHAAPIVDRARQIEAVRRIRALLSEGYSDCRPRRALLDRLAGVEAALMKSGARKQD